jgi:hypothetical protein
MIATLSLNKEMQTGLYFGAVPELLVGMNESFAVGRHKET